MEAIGAANQMGPQMYALKQATKIQEDTVLKLLDSLANQTVVESPSPRGLADQVIGANLDIRA